MINIVLFCVFFSPAGTNLKINYCSLFYSPKGFCNPISQCHPIAKCHAIFSVSVNSKVYKEVSVCKILQFIISMCYNIFISF